ncbi:hypothetical protein FBY40_1410 [Microbacterium sp. SLBN-154]|uniref:hypothetical protein n=1 Tax=Microbacterium sp. SLBN-154 TaxID=2768458 RepID=UPI00114FD374|nr:hypothetical protein [Microbacterium sp. SLBN-154]TQK18920.1 hypothetical protein FBY40_1410 [Microbacterium sp. SLBN-154]
MKTWVVRLVSLLVFNIAVLLMIGFLTPARVGWAALWAGIVLTAIVIWIKPLLSRWFGGMAARSADRRTRVGEKVAEFFVAFAIAFLVWIATVLLSGVSIGGWFWGWILPPVLLMIGWAIYDVIDDRVEAHAGALYDRATGTRAAAADATGPRPAVGDTRATAQGRKELRDGLTEEQRRMLDEL